MASAGASRLRELLDAVVAVGSGLELPSMLRRITELAADLADARYAALGVLDETGTRLSEFITVGVDDEVHAEIGHLPEGHGILGLLIVEATPLRLPDLSRHPDSFGFPPGHPEMSSFLGVPILAGDRVFGNLYLTEKQTASEFTDVDEELVVGLAAAAGVAIDNARLHAKVGDLVLAEDRERIARDLHDTVIQRLFATGLSLQGTVPLVERDPTTATARIDAAIDDLDTTVKHIRTAIFALETTRPHESGLRDRILELCRDAAGALGFGPSVVFDGPLDAIVPDEVGADLLATLREALSNVARHAQATSVEVTVCIADGHVVLEVADDGRGIAPGETSPEHVSGHGIVNMTARAARHRGSFDIDSSSGGGSTLRWRVPVSEAE